MKNTETSAHADFIERLTKLEYAIRQSMTVREDQDEVADRLHTDEAACCGVSIEDAVSKGELLNAVQTLVRAMQKNRLK